MQVILSIQTAHFSIPDFAHKSFIKSNTQFFDVLNVCRKVSTRFYLAVSSFDLFHCEHFTLIFNCNALLRYKSVATKNRVIVKNRFLQEALKLFGSVTRELFEIFYEMSLIKEIIFVADFCQRFYFIQIFKNRIKADN